MWLSENVDKGSEVVGVILGALMEVDMELVVKSFIGKIVAAGV